MSAAGWVIVHFFQKENLIKILIEGYPVYIQIALGISYGIIAAFSMARLMKLQAFNKVNRYFDNIFAGTRIYVIEIFWFSFCAGVGEEILFRAGLQPYLGVWLTALVFIVLHAYIYQVKGLAMAVFVAAMVVMSAGLGYLFIYVGLISAITAHITFDIVGFSRIKIDNDRRIKNKKVTVQPFEFEHGPT